MRDLIRRQVPGLGEVTFGSITVGTIREACKLAEQVDEDEQPRVFADFVLASMVVDPPTAREDVGKLPEEALAAVVDVAVERLQAREEFDKTPSHLALRERFFRAHITRQQQLFKGLSPTATRYVETLTDRFRGYLATLEPRLPHMAAITDQMFERFRGLTVPVSVVDWPSAMDTSAWAKVLDASERIVKLARPVLQAQEGWMRQVRQMARGLDDITRRMSANLAAVTLLIQRAASLGIFDDLVQLVQAHKDAAEAFKASGWPIAPSMPFELRERVVTMHKQGKTRYISRTIMGYYQRSNCRHLIESVESWNSYPLFTPRMHIIKDALEAHCSGRYTLSVPTLVPQIEGILSEYVVTNGLVAKLGKIKQVYNAALGDMDEYALSEWVIATTLLWQLQTSTYAFIDFEAELKKPGSRRGVTRHTIAHGIAFKYDKPVHSLKCFLLLDAVSALHDL